MKYFLVMKMTKKIRWQMYLWRFNHDKLNSFRKHYILRHIFRVYAILYFIGQYSLLQLKQIYFPFWRESRFNSCWAGIIGPIPYGWRKHENGAIIAVKPYHHITFRHQIMIRNYLKMKKISVSFKIKHVDHLMMLLRWYLSIKSNLLNFNLV